MKKINFFIVLLVIFFSCGKNNDLNGTYICKGIKFPQDTANNYNVTLFLTETNNEITGTVKWDETFSSPIRYGDYSKGYIHFESDRAIFDGKLLNNSNDLMISIEITDYGIARNLTFYKQN